MPSNDLQDRATIKIGNLASQSGVSVETLRYYEQRGLVQPSGRRVSGYREYPTDAVRLVRFIKRAQGLGFTLGEVEELVRLRNDAWSGDAPWQLREAAVSKIEDIDRRIRELNALRSALAEMLDACDASCADPESMQPIACPLIEAFETESPAPVANEAHSKPNKQRRPT